MNAGRVQALHDNLEGEPSKRRRVGSLIALAMLATDVTDNQASSDEEESQASFHLQVSDYLLLINALQCSLSNVACFGCAPRPPQDAQPEFLD